MTKQDEKALEIGLILHRIALLLDDDNFDRVKDDLEDLGDKVKELIYGSDTDDTQG